MIAAAETALSMPVVFLAGVASYLSPCVLPLVPAYLAYMGGTSIETITEGTVKSRRLLPATLSFVGGFTSVFVALGMALTAIGSYLRFNQNDLTRISGVLIVLMGLVFLGVIPLPWLYSEKRFQMKPAKSIPGSFVMGAAFGFGWTPCIGPALGASLSLAATESSPGRGALLLLVYSLGLGVPFILSAMGVARLTGALAWIRKRQMLIVRASGVLLVAFGLLFVFNRVFVVSAWLQSAMAAVGLEFFWDI